MEELVELISRKVGISQDKASKAVLIMNDYLKSKLSPVLFANIEVILETPNISEEEAKEVGLFKFP